MRTAVPLLAGLLAVLAGAGCVELTTETRVAPDAELGPVQVFFVERKEHDPHCIATLLEEELRSQGRVVRTGNAGEMPSDVDVLVRFEERWRKVFLLWPHEELEYLGVSMLDALTGHPLAIGRTAEGEGGRSTVRLLLTELLLGARQGPADGSGDPLSVEGGTVP